MAVAALALWAGVLVGRAASVVRSYLRLRGVKRRAAPWNHPLQGGRRRIRVLVSSEISSPTAVGFLHPAVVLPETLCADLTGTELHCVLLHEAAHLARYDDWCNLAARGIGAVMALHPVVWWMLTQIEREREIACDDWVVAQTGTARGYAEMLAHLVELRIRPAESALATGIFSRRSRLLERIDILLRRGRMLSPTVARIPAGAGAVMLAILVLAGASAPHWIAFAQRLEFEVASVKTSAGGPFEFAPKRSSDRVSIHMTHLASVITYAYHIPFYQVIGYDKTPIAYDWYDIDAKAPGDATDDQVRLMFQSLLEDRFKLKVHRETRELPEYELTVAKGNAKLKPASGDEPMKVEIEGRHLTWPKGNCASTAWLEGAHLICHAASIDQIVGVIRGEMGAPVVDRTGLTGLYDLNLLYLSDRQKPRDDGDAVPLLPAALQAELGLKLEKGKGPVEVLVIDHLEKPSGN